MAARQAARLSNTRGRFRRLPSGQYDDLGAHGDAAVEILDIPVDQANAARGDERADGRGLIGAVDAIERVAKIESARTERIALAARHEARQVGLAVDHFL